MGDSPKPKRSSRRRIGLAALLTSVFVIAATLGGGFWLDSRAGHQFLVAQATSQAEKAGYELEITGVEGSLFGALRIEQISLSQNQAVLFSGDSLVFDWRPNALWSRDLRIEALAAQSISLALPTNPVPTDEPAKSIGEQLEAAQAAINSLALPVDITLRALSIGRLGVKTATASAPFIFALQASASWPRDYAKARDLSLTLERLDGAGQANIDLSYAAATEQLSLNTQIDVPDAASMAALTGLAYPLQISLIGEGRLANWQGQLTGSLRDYMSIESALTLRRDGDAIAIEAAPFITLPATLEIPGLVPQVQVSIAGQLTDNVFDLSSLSIAAGALDARVSGVVDIDDLTASRLQLDANLAATTDVYGLVPGLGYDDLTVAGVVAPQTDETDLQLSVAIDGLRQAGFALDVLTLDVGAASLAPLLTGQDQTLEWGLNAQGITTDNKDLDTVLDRFGRQKTVAGQIDISSDIKRLGLSVDPMELFGGQLDGQIRLADGRLDQAAIDIRDLPLHELFALANATPMVEGLLHARLRAVPDGDRVSLDGTLALNEASYQDPRLDQLLGPAPALSVNADDINAPIAVELTGDALTAGATIKGATSPEQTVDYALLISEAVVLHEALAGAFDLNGQVTHTGNEILVSAALAPLALAGQDFALEALDLPINLNTQQATQPSLQARYGALPIALTADRIGWGPEVVVKQARLALDNEAAVFNASGLIETDGALDFQLSGGIEEADLIGLIRPGFGLGLVADLNADIGGTVAAPLVSAQVSDLMLSHGNRRLERGDIKLGVTPAADDGLALTADITGNLVEPASRRMVQLNADATRDNQGVVRLSSLTADYGDLPIRLLAPTTITQNTNTINLGPTRLGIAGQELALEGEYGAARVLADLQLQNWALAPLAAALDLPSIEGGLDLALSLNATRQVVDLESTLSLSGLTMEAAQQAGLPVYDFAADTRWNGRVLTLEASGSDRNGQAPLRVDLSIPLTAERNATAALSGATLPGRAPLNGAITGTVDMALANQIVEAAGHRLNGALDIDLALAGTVDDPGLAGQVVMNDAEYRNLLHGIAFNYIDVRLAGSLDGLDVEQLRAVAVNGGVIEGNGAIRFGDDAPLSLDLAFNQAQIIQSDLADLILDGSLGVAGRLPEHDVTGRLTVTEAEIRIPRRLPQSVARLEVEEEIGDQADEAEAAPAATIVTNLDIQIDAPGRLFVRGLGLDVTLGGGVSVEGTAADPLISGGFELVQGRLDVAGQSWAFDRGGLVFDAQGAPKLDIVASRAAGDITAIIAVEGPVSGPSISLTSEPPMAQGEIASRILFGEGMGSVSAVQAVQATELLATLQGNSGRGVLGTARETLGIDQLNVDQTADGASVSAGTFVSDGVFIGVNQGVGDVGSEVEVEVDITDTIKFEGTTGNRNNSSVGLSIEWDY